MIHFVLSQFVFFPTGFEATLLEKQKCQYPSTCPLRGYSLIREILQEREHAQVDGLTSVVSDGRGRVHKLAWKMSEIWDAKEGKGERGEGDTQRMTD